jgi:hypothetical protein
VCSIGENDQKGIRKKVLIKKDFFKEESNEKSFQRRALNDSNKLYIFLEVENRFSIKSLLNSLEKGF